MVFIICKGKFPTFAKGSFPQTGVCSAVLPSPGNVGSCAAPAGPGGLPAVAGAGWQLLSRTALPAPLSTLSCFPFQIFRRADKNGECFVLPPPPPRSLAPGEAAALPRREARCKSKGRGQAAPCLEDKRLSALPDGEDAGQGLGGGSPASPPACHCGQSLPVLVFAQPRSHRLRCWLLSGDEQREGGQSRLCSTAGQAPSGFFSTPCRTGSVSAPCLGGPVPGSCWSPWCLRFGSVGRDYIRHLETNKSDVTSHFSEPSSHLGSSLSWQIADARSHFYCRSKCSLGAEVLHTQERGSS